MNGIVSLLDSKHYQIIEDIWSELKREFGVQGVYVTPYPHFSYHVAQQYNLEMLEPILYNLASHTTSLQVRTSGLGIFTGEHPVLYVPVARSPQLTQLHQQLWETICRTADGAQDYYSPEQWMPHITIGFGDINHEQLPKIVHYLCMRNFNWEIEVDNIALIFDTGTKQELRNRFVLGQKETV